MKGKLLPALIAAAIAPTALGGASYTFIPDTPSIEAPADASIDIALHPEISGSAPAAKERFNTANDYSVTLASAEWLFYEHDENLTILGGFENLYPDFSNSYKFWLIESPIEFTIDGEAVTHLEITNSGEVTLVNANRDTLGRVIVSSDNAHQVQSALATDIIELRQISPTLVTVTWYLENSTNSGTTWTNTLQAVLDSDGPKLGFKMTQDDFASDYFNLTETKLACYMREGGSEFSGIEISAALLKAAHNDNSQSGTSRVCYTDEASAQSGGDLIKVSQYANNDLLGETTTFTELTVGTNPYQMQTDESFSPGTEYDAVLRYLVTDGYATGKSAWSDEITFSTELNSAYTLDLPSTAGIEVGVPADLTFTVNSTGEHGGAPKIEVVLPFNAIDSLNGSLSDFFDADTENAEANCGVSIISDDTILSCTTLMDAGDSDTVDLTATFYAAGSYDVEYRVCETKLDRCNDVAYQALAVEIEAEAQVDPTTDGSGSSSSGGAMFWLTLLALPLLRLRRAV